MSDEPQREDDKDPAPIKHSDAERASSAPTPPDSAQKQDPDSDQEPDAQTES